MADFTDPGARTRGSSLPIETMSLAIAALVAVAYVASGSFGLAFFAEPGQPVTLVWPPTGIALAALWIGGRAQLIGIFAGACAVNLLFGASLPAALLIASGNSAAAALGVSLLSRVPFSGRFDRPLDLAALVGAGALLPSAVSATIGVFALWLGGSSGIESIWWSWWLGDVGGVVVVTPFLLIGINGTPSWRDLIRQKEAWLVLALVALSGAAVFGDLLRSMSPRLVFVFVPYLLLVWAGLRLGPRGATAAAFLASVIALAGRARGAGPLEDNAHASLLLAYVATLSSTAVVTASIVAQRDAAEAERRSLEEQLLHARALEGIALLAGGIAHDFNNLLLVIQANASLMRPVGGDTELVSEIENAARSAADLCRQLMSYAGRRPPLPSAVDLGAITHEMCHLLRARIPAEISVDVRAEGRAIANADATQVRQVLLNLVLNASDAIGPGGGHIWLRTGETSCDLRYLRQTFLRSEAEPGRFAFVEVRDDGCGMDEETSRRMFDPFFTTKQSGRGLGLMTVAGVARSHRGAIKVESALGRGSTFLLLLPVWDGPNTEPATAPEESPPKNERKILVADDEPAVLRSTKRLLARAGYEVITAVDGAQALAIYESNAEQISAVVLDVSMPGMTGPEAFERMCVLRPVPLVLVSGNPPEGVDVESASRRFLAKPFGSEALIQAVSEVLGERR